VCTSSFIAPPKSLVLKFLAFLVFGPRVSSVSQISVENFRIGFLQFFERDIKLRCVILSLKFLLLVVMSPKKPKKCYPSLAIRFSSLVDKGL
jgi:hypothetical protein